MTTDILLMIAVPLLLVGGVVLIVRPVLGLYLIAGTVPLEAALLFGGRSAPALIAMAVLAAWGLQKLLRRQPLSSLFSPGLVQIALILLAFACLSVFWAEHTRRMPSKLLLLAQLIVLLILVLDLASSWDRVAWVVKLVVVGATVGAGPGGVPRPIPHPARARRMRDEGKRRGKGSLPGVKDVAKGIVLLAMALYSSVPLRVPGAFAPGTLELVSRLPASP